MISKREQYDVTWNLEIALVDQGSEEIWHQRTHNIVVDTGRQLLAESITPSSLGPGTFVRTRDEVVRYIGFGIGGARQSNPSALVSPLADAFPAGYGGANVQTDTDSTVAKLERPVQVTAAPLWMQEIATPGTFPTVQSTKFIAVFANTDINVGAFASVPLSEIALYMSSADPTLPNGGGAAYPGTGGHMLAYDTFDPIAKTGSFSIEVRWEWRFG